MPAVVVKKVEWDFANIQIGLSGGSEARGVRAAPFALPDFDAIMLKSTIERTKRWGPNRNVIQRGEGRGDHEASITLPQYYWNYCIERAKELAVPLAYLEMSLAVSFAKTGVPIKTHTAVGVMLTEITLDAEEGNDLIAVEVPLDPMNIFWNGVDIFGKSLSST